MIPKRLLYRIRRSLALLVAMAMALAFVPVVTPTADAAMSHTVVTGLEITAVSGEATKNYYLPLDVVPANTSGDGFIYEVSVMGTVRETIKVKPTIASGSSFDSWQTSGTGVASESGTGDTLTFEIDAAALPTANGTAQITLNLTGANSGNYTIRFQSVTAITVNVTGEYGTDSGNWVYLADFSDVPVVAGEWAAASLGSSYQVLDGDAEGSRTFVVNRNGNEGQYDKRVRVAVVPGDGYYVKSFKDGDTDVALTESSDGSFQYYLIGTDANEDLASALHKISVEFAEIEYEITQLSQKSFSDETASWSLFGEDKIFMDELGSFADIEDKWSDVDIAAAATASFEAGYKVTGISPAKNAALVFKVVDSADADASPSTKLIAVDPAYTNGSDSWPNTFWDVLKDKAYIDGSVEGEGEYNADLSAKMEELKYTGYWGPAAGCDLAEKTSGGSYEYGAYDFYFFAEKEGTYTITVGLIDAALGELAKETVTIKVTGADPRTTDITIGLMPDGGAKAIKVPSAVENAKTNVLGSVEDENIKIYGVSGDVIETLRAVEGVVAVDYNLSGTGFAESAYEKARINVSVTGESADSAENAYLMATNSEETYELIKTGFMGLWDGQDASNFNTVESLTFFATAAGEYTVQLDLVDLSDSDKILATGKTTIKVTGADPDPGTSANVTTETELADKLTAGKTDITVTDSFGLSNDSTPIPYGTKLTIASGKSLTIPEEKTLSIYGTLAFESDAKVSIAGELQFGYKATITSNGGTLELDGGVIRFVPDQDTVMLMALSVSNDITDISQDVLDQLSATAAGGTVKIGADEGVAFISSVTVPSDVTLDVSGELNVESDGSLTLSTGAVLVLNSGASSVIEGELDLKGTINIGNGVTVDLSSAVVHGGGNIVLAPGAILLSSDLDDKVTVADFAGNSLSHNGSGYTAPAYTLSIDPVAGVGLGVSFKIAVSAGVDSEHLYLIVQSTVEGEAVSLVMIAVGEYEVVSSGYETYVSYSDADQVDVWLVFDDSSSGVPDWTDPTTGMYLQTATWPVTP